MGPFTNFHGMGASPILEGDKLIMLVDQDQNAHLIAINKDDGSLAWKTDRPDMVHSFSTPILYRPPNGPAEIVTAGSYQMIGYAAKTGEKLWWVRGLTYQVKSVPVLGGDTIYFNGWAPGGEPEVRIVLPPFEEMLAKHDANHDRLLSQQEIPKDWLPQNWAMQDLDKDDRMDARDWFYYQSRRTSTNSTLAIKLGGRGDVTDTHVLWRHQKSLPDVPAVLLYRGVLYAVKNGGIATALDPATGAILKQGRLDAIDDYYSSPVAGDGKIYMTSRAGKIVVLEADGEFTTLAVNDLAEETFATPALEQGRIYVRTNAALWAFGSAE
jgi:outer membrane protein assembly factor BamB